MKRLTTDTPESNLPSLLNLFFAKDGEAWVRGAGPAPGYGDITLNQWIRKIIDEHAISPELFKDIDDETLAEIMADWLLDGSDSKEGLIATLYNAGWAFAELRARLKQYEDMEEAGRLLKLRVGIGDIVYTIMDGKILPMEIQYIYVSSKGRIRYHAAEAVYEKNFREPAFGRDVFVSREAAERKLKEARDGTA